VSVWRKLRSFLNPIGWFAVALSTLSGILSLPEYIQKLKNWVASIVGVPVNLDISYLAYIGIFSFPLYVMFKAILYFSKGNTFEAEILNKKEFELGETVFFHVKFKGELKYGFFDSMIKAPLGKLLPDGEDHTWSRSPETLADMDYQSLGKLHGKKLHESTWSWPIPLNFPTGEYTIFIRVYDHLGEQRERKPIKENKETITIIPRSGKSEKPETITRVDKNKQELARLEASEKQKLEEKAKRRENLEDMLKTHYHQIINEVYDKWFVRPSSSVQSGIRTNYEYEISNAKIIYSDEMKIKIIKLEEPSHLNKRLVDESMNHLQHYPETYSLWDITKTMVNQNLKDVERLWYDLIQSITDKISANCPQLAEYHGYGVKYTDYYSLRNTFNLLWICILDNRYLSELRIYPDGKYFCVGDSAMSLGNSVMEQFIQVIIDLAKDNAFQERWKTISNQRNKIEANLGMFKKTLDNITDDVIRKDEVLKGSCSTCSPWLEKLNALGA